MTLQGINLPVAKKKKKSDNPIYHCPRSYNTDVTCHFHLDPSVSSWNEATLIHSSGCRWMPVWLGLNGRGQITTQKLPKPREIHRIKTRPRKSYKTVTESTSYQNQTLLKLQISTYSTYEVRIWGYTPASSKSTDKTPANPQHTYSWQWNWFDGVSTVPTKALEVRSRDLFPASWRPHCWLSISWACWLLGVCGETTERGGRGWHSDNTGPHPSPSHQIPYWGQGISPAQALVLPSKNGYNGTTYLVGGVP